MLVILFSQNNTKTGIFITSLAIFKFVLNIATHFPRSYKIIEQTGFDQNDPF